MYGREQHERLFPVGKKRNSPFAFTNFGIKTLFHGTLIKLA